MSRVLLSGTACAIAFAAACGGNSHADPADPATVTAGAAALSAQTTTTDAAGAARVSAILSQPGTSVVRASSVQLPAIATTVTIQSFSAPSETVDVTVSNFAFQPATVSVPVNALVRWVWQGTSGVAHTITASREPLFGSPQDALSGDGVVFQFLFAVPGTYAYECTLHSGKNAPN